MEKKVFFFDIDETLLSWKTGKVPESAVYALEELKKRGHLTFINTGRMFSTIPEVVRELPVVGYVCGCGTQILYEGETLLLKKISEERLNEIVNLIWECNGDIILEGEKDCYFSRKKSRFDRIEKLRQSFHEIGWGAKYCIEDEEAECAKYCFYTDEQTDKKRILDNLSVDMDIMDRGGEFYEVSPKPCSKASGIDFVLNYFGVGKEQAFVFGDSSNDLSMFKAVEHAIAMGKHDPILEPHAEFITKEVEEDGILYALQHYGIL